MDSSLLGLGLLFGVACRLMLWSLGAAGGHWLGLAAGSYSSSACYLARGSLVAQAARLMVFGGLVIALNLFGLGSHVPAATSSLALALCLATSYLRLPVVLAGNYFTLA